MASGGFFRLKKYSIIFFSILFIVACITMAIYIMKSPQFTANSREWLAKFNINPKGDENVKRTSFIIIGISFFLLFLASISGLLGALLESFRCLIIFLLQQLVILMANFLHVLANPDGFTILNLIVSAAFTTIGLFFLKDLYILQREKAKENRETTDESAIEMGS